MSAANYIITRPYPSSGLGANLLSMVAALYACEQTNRTLVVDWTGMECLSNKQTNYFTAFFEPLRSWRGVDILYVNDPDDPSRAFQYESADALRPGGDQYRDLLAGRLQEPVILLEAFHYRLFKHAQMSPAEVFYYTRDFYQRLTPRAVLRARLAASQPRFERQIVIALHVRSGNGEFAAGRQYANRVKTGIFDHDAFLRRAHRACRDCCARFPESIRSDWSVFVATDSQEMQDRLLRIPGAFALRQRFPPAGTGHQFADFDPAYYGSYSDIESAHETITDMFMMAQCEGLVCNESAFNWYAQYMTMYFSGNVRLLERYFEHPIKRLGRAALQLTGGRAWLR